MFEPLAAVSKFMEGENYILISSYFGALRTIENVFEPREGDSPEVAQIRSTMFNDHFGSRVTLDQAVQNPLHVLGTFVDPRFISLFFCFRFLSEYFIRAGLNLIADFRFQRHRFLQQIYRR